MDLYAHLVPMYIIYLDGNRLNASFEGPLRSLEVLDRLNRPSECTLAFDYTETSEADIDLFQFFSWLTIRMGYKDEMRDVFAGEITAKRTRLPEYGPRLFTVTASNVLQRLDNAKRIRHFWEKTPSEMIKAILDEYNLGADVASFGRRMGHWRTDEMTDMELILYIAGMYGKDLYCRDKKVYVKDEMMMQKDEIIYERGKNLIEFWGKDDPTGQVGGVRYQGWDVNKREGFWVVKKISEIEKKIGGGKDWTKLYMADSREFSLATRHHKGEWPWVQHDYPIDIILNDIMDFYLENEDDHIKNLFAQKGVKGNIGARQYLIRKIEELNKIKDTISCKKEKIQVPLDTDFFKEAFPNAFVMAKGDTTISIGVLDQMDYEKELEEIVAEKRRPEDITKHGRAGTEINWALHKLKIHTCPVKSPSFASLLGSIDSAPVVEGIKIFQKEYMDRQNPKMGFDDTGQICGNTLIAMNQALKEGWTRELYFYYKPVIGDSFESYINDVDIDNGKYDNFPESMVKDMLPADGTTIYAKKEGDARETNLGNVLYFPPKERFGRRGIMHDAAILFIADNNNVKEKICSGTVKSEGKGYDAINTYDSNYLSIGLIQWGWEELYNFLRYARNSKDYPIDFDALFRPYGFNINDSGTMENKRFIIDDVAYGISGKAPKELKKLKFVYCFIKAANDANFRKLQSIWATQRVSEIAAISVKGKPVTSYVTSEKGLALVFDHHVNAQSYVARCVGKAVDEVIEKLQKEWNENMLSGLNANDRTFVKVYFDSSAAKTDGDKTRFSSLISNPANWGDYEEKLFIDAYKRLRTNANFSGMNAGNAMERNQNIDDVRPALLIRRNSIKPEDLK